MGNTMYLTRIVLVYLFIINSAIALDWNIETVHDPKYFNITERSLVTDANGQPHIFYGGSHLFHKYYDGNQWLTEIIDNSPDIGYSATATMDSSGFFHVIYADSDNAFYATNKSGSWVIQSLAIPNQAKSNRGSEYSFFETIGVGGISVDSNGIVHLAFFNTQALYNPQELFYGNNSSGSWSFQMIDSDLESTASGRISILVDSVNAIHIVYYDKNLLQLKHATNKTGNWAIVPISGSYLIEYTSAVLDSLDNLHVALSTNAKSLEYITNKSGTWITEELDTCVSANQSISVAIDNSNSLYVSYTCDQLFPSTKRDFVYVTNKSNSWIKTVLANDVTVNRSSIAVDSNQNIHIAYMDLIYKDIGLNYATNESGQWVLSRVEDSDQPQVDSLVDKVGVEATTIHDNIGNIHIVYRDGSWAGGQLMYATNESGTWKYESIAGLPESSFTDKLSLIIDNNNVPYVFYTAGNGVMYAYKSGNIWLGGEVEFGAGKAPAENFKISLAIDSDNIIHATYFLHFSGDLQYAKLINGLWQIETIASTGESFGNYSDYTTSLTLDVDGVPHIGYLDREGDLIYATNSSGQWVNTYIASSTNEHRWGEKDYIMFQNGVVHMVYSSAKCIALDCFNTGLEYATNKSGEWVVNSIDYEEYELYDVIQSYPMISPVIALDSLGNVSVSYHFKEGSAYNSSKYLRSARKVGDLWRISSVETNPFTENSTKYDGSMKFSSIAYDDNGNSIISYFDEFDGTLNLASSNKTNSALINIKVDLKDFDFGQVNIGETKSTVVSIQNIGTLPLELYDVELLNNTSGIYSIDLSKGISPCVLLPISLDSNEECTFGVSFTPSTSNNTDTIELLINSNDPELPSLVAVFSGKGKTKISTTPSGGGGGGGSFSVEILLLLAMIWLQYYQRKKAI